MATENPWPDIEAALEAARERDDRAGFLRILAVGKVVLPQLQSVEQAKGWRLPIYETDDRRCVMAFSSQERLADSGVDAVETITTTGTELSQAWPQDEELWLAINLGSESAALVPPDVMRAMASGTTPQG
ncbi:SseB protein N-terminal domain-containing protein [Haloechinothrix alba]|uniref:SseB protein N-terminal domain-containing protein n=1 Tax=Haloechinothrix alba TaxID=664784 RepID=A0A238VMA5_9PSEU|nr:SseB family protein [Haloechinothrix alba]SNR34873.1 SseB protein N-terminal domain-containing protein [Haloechinothrix alba]